MPSLDHNRLKTTTLIVSPIQACKCGTRIDVSRYEPLQDLTCPGCSAPFVVEGQLDRFKLTGIAGHGGTGTVYRAFDPQLGRQIALKVVREDRAGDEEILAQLEAEAKVTASLNHPHVLRVFSVGRAQGRFYIAMELIQGGSLDDLLTKYSVLPEEQALEVAVQMASGLQAAQQAGLVHRDVKPGNVMFSNASTAKVMDFGLAVFEQQAAVATGGSVWGSPFYMAPERLENVPEDFRSDIYSLGTVLFQMLTGRPPFDAGTPQEVAWKRLTHPAPSVLTYAPKVSNATAFVVKKMLERNRDDRFPNYADLIQSLQFARAELGQKGAPQAARVALDQASRKVGMWMTIGLAGFLLIAAIVAVVMVRKSRARDEVSPIPMAAVSRPGVAANAPAAAAAPAAEIAPGIYRVRNAMTDQVLDVYAFGSRSDTRIKTWGAGPGLNQRWIVQPAGTGYKLIAYHSCKALEAVPTAGDEESQIRQNTLNGEPAQVWRIEAGNPGYVRIVSTLSGKALTVVDVDAKEGAPVLHRALEKTLAQQWKFESLGSVPADVESILKGGPLAPAPAPVLVRPGTDPKGSKFMPVSLAGVMNCDSRTGTFSNPNDSTDTIHPRMTGWVEAGGVPFQIVDAKTASSGKDLLVLCGGEGRPHDEYPKKAEISMNGARLTKLHIIGGVAGWGYPWQGDGNYLGVSAGQITVVRAGGKRQVLQLRNGVEFADYYERNEVPGSAYVEGLIDHGRQARFFTKDLEGTEPVEMLIIESFDTRVAPAYLAITGEKVP